MKTFWIRFIPLIALLTILGCNDAIYESGDDMAEAASGRVTHIDAKALRDMQNAKMKFDLVDVRDESEFAQGSIPGALNITRGKLEWVLPNLISDRGSDIVLFCKKGSRSILAAQSLMALKYRNVRILEGGFDAWKVAYPGVITQPATTQIPAAQGAAPTQPAAASSGSCGG